MLFCSVDYESFNPLYSKVIDRICWILLNLFCESLLTVTVSDSKYEIQPVDIAGDRGKSAVSTPAHNHGDKVVGVN